MCVCRFDKTKQPVMPPPVRIGTMFSGLDMPIHAIRPLLPSGRCNHVFSVEVDKRCREVLTSTVPPGPLCLIVDVRDHGAIRALPDVQVLWMSPPCINYSSNGKQEGMAGTHGPLIFDGLEYLSVHRPKLVIVEQVVGALHKKHWPMWRDVMKKMKKYGY